MWSRSLFRSFGGRPWPSDGENKKKRRQDKRHASSSSENVTQRNGSAHATPTAGGSWWSHQRAAIGSAFAGMGNALNRLKPTGLEVKVDVDMVKPTLISIQTAAEESWLKVPPPARMAARYIGVAMISAWLMHRIDKRTISRQRRLQEELQDQIKKLEGANEALRAPRSIYQDGMGEYITAMTAAVSQATHSAARAAEAAAVASESCAIRSKSAIRPVRKTRNQEDTPAEI